MSQTLLAALQAQLDSEVHGWIVSWKSAGCKDDHTFDDLRIGVHPAIAAHLNVPGRFICEDEQCVFDLGKPDATARYDASPESTWTWQIEDCKDLEEIIPVNGVPYPHGGMAFMALYRHKTLPLWFVTMTDGGSGVWGIYKLEQTN